MTVRECVEASKDGRPWCFAHDQPWVTCDGDERRAMSDVWLVFDGDYEGVHLVGVYESLEAAKAHNPGEWELKPWGTWMLGDSSGGKYVEEAEVQGPPSSPSRIPQDKEVAG